jgi:hypothetical protein
MSNKNNVVTDEETVDYIDRQLAKIEEEEIEIEKEKVKLGYLKQRNNTVRLHLDRVKLDMKIEEAKKGDA